MFDSLECLPGCAASILNSTTFFVALAPFVIWLALLCYSRSSAGRRGPSQLTRLGHYRRYFHERHSVRCGALPPPSLLARLVLRAASEHTLLRLFQPLQWAPRPPHTRAEQLTVLLAVLQLKATLVAFVFLPSIAGLLFPELPVLGSYAAAAIVAALLASLLPAPLRLLIDQVRSIAPPISRVSVPNRLARVTSSDCVQTLARRNERAMREPLDADGMTERHVLARALVSNFDARNTQHAALLRFQHCLRKRTFLAEMKTRMAFQVRMRKEEGWWC